MMPESFLDWVETATRFVIFGAAILLMALFVFYLLICPLEDGRRFRLLFLPNKLILVLLSVGLVAQIAWTIELLVSLSSETGLTAEECWAFLFGTRFGRLGLLRCCLLGALLGYRVIHLLRGVESLSNDRSARIRRSRSDADGGDGVLEGRRTRLCSSPEKRSLIGILESLPLRPLEPGLWLEAGLVLAQLASLAWLGHAGAGVGPWGNVQLGADLVHLVGSAFWPAGLFPLLLCLKLAIPQEIKETALRRFSDLSVVMVVIIGGTGVLNACFRLQDLSQIVTTSYGKYIFLKTVCFLLLICFGAVNRLKLIPRLRGTAQDISPARESWLALRRNVLIEQLLFVIVLVAVARLGLLPPPHEG
ncbi:MAG: CopD family protein [Verrucomicrobia bacterium]|nr:CopD family protein [Verrucomicrobiota bacterium]